MSWEQLQQAAFRGVEFHCTSANDAGKKTQVRHAATYANGAVLEDTGADAETLRVGAVFFGDGWLGHLQDFLAALRQSGSGDLVHPLFGQLRAGVDEWTIDQGVEEVDSARVNVTFVRDGVLQSKPEGDLARRHLDDAIGQAARVLQASVENVVGLMSEAGPADGQMSLLQRLVALGNTMRRALLDARAQVQSVVTSGLDVLGAPYAWAADMAALVDGIIDQRPYDRDVVMARWRALHDQLGRALRVPNDGRYGTAVDTWSIGAAGTGDTGGAPGGLLLRDSRVVDLSLRAQALYGMTRVAADMLARERDMPALTPVELQQVARDVRIHIGTLMTDARAAQSLQAGAAQVDPLTQHAMLVAMAQVAAAIQAATDAVIARRPALRIRTVGAHTSIRLLAHHWYGDHSRADELIRLNPGLRHPNFLYPGDRLNAYAR